MIQDYSYVNVNPSVAVQYNGDNVEEINKVLGIRSHKNLSSGDLVIPRLKDHLEVAQGEWIVWNPATIFDIHIFSNEHFMRDFRKNNA